MVFPLLSSQRLALTPINYEDRDAIFALGTVEQKQRYLSFMAEKLANAEAKVIEYIDVYYVETLFWGASSHTIAVGWLQCLPTYKSFISIFMVKRRKTNAT